MAIARTIRGLAGVACGLVFYFGLAFSAIAYDMRGPSAALGAALVVALSLMAVLIIRRTRFLSLTVSATILVLWFTATLVASGPSFVVSLAMAPAELFTYGASTLLPLCMGVPMLTIALVHFPVRMTSDPTPPRELSVSGG